MKPHVWRERRRSQKGSVAVEAAVCIALILVPLVGFMFAFGKFFWHYTVVQKATHDAVLYMAKAPLAEVRSGQAATMANFILRRETGDLDSGTQVTASLQCGFRQSVNSFSLAPGPCDLANIPFAVQSTVIMTMRDPFSLGAGGGSKLQFVLNARMRHAGK
jgi:hypothetical protein